MLQHLPIILVLVVLLIIAPEACKFIQEATRDIEGGN